MLDKVKIKEMIDLIKRCRPNDVDLMMEDIHVHGLRQNEIVDIDFPPHDSKIVTLAVQRLKNHNDGKIVVISTPMLENWVLPFLQSRIDKDPIRRVMKEWIKPHAPSWCSKVRSLRRGPGGHKLTRKRLIKKWLKIRPGSSFPKGHETRKVCEIHHKINSMYYPKTC